MAQMQVVSSAPISLRSPIHISPATSKGWPMHSGSFSGPLQVGGGSGSGNGSGSGGSGSSSGGTIY